MGECSGKQGVHSPPIRAAWPEVMQLKDYVGHGGLVINWEVFGSGGLQVRCS